jgi:predicted N-acyltransferase
MTHNYRLAHSIREFDEAAWDTAVDSQIAMTHRWHRVMEASLRDYHPLYLLLEDQTGPLVAAVANQTKFFGDSSKKVAFLKHLILVLNSPYNSLHCGIAVRPGVSLDEIAPHLESALGQVCRQQRHLIWAINNVPSQDLPVWRKRHFHVFDLLPLSYIDLTWASYEEYLASLSATRRRRLRRMHRRAEENGVTFEYHRHLGAWTKELYPLLCELYAHHGREGSPFHEEIFAALDREMPGEAVLIVGKVKDKVAGFGMGLLQEQIMWGPMIGLHYELARSNQVYFLLMDEVVRWCIRHDLSRVYFGVTSYQPKRLAGFQLRPRHVCFRANSQLLNRLVGLTLPLAQGVLKWLAS